MIPFVAVAGYSDSGKTTVMASLIRVFKQQGYKVAAVKHAAHGYTTDRPGTDSWHYTEAGADNVIVAGPNSCTVHEFFQVEKSLREILDRITGVDIILVEGFKNEPAPRIEIYRPENNADRIPADGNVLAVVSDVPVPGELPQFTFNEMEQLADFIKKYLERKNNSV